MRCPSLRSDYDDFVGDSSVEEEAVKLLEIELTYEMSQDPKLLKKLIHDSDIQVDDLLVHLAGSLLDKETPEVHKVWFDRETSIFMESIKKAIHEMAVDKYELNK